MTLRLPPRALAGLGLIAFAAPFAASGCVGPALRASHAPAAQPPPSPAAARPAALSGAARKLSPSLVVLREGGCPDVPGALGALGQWRGKPVFSHAGAPPARGLPSLCAYAWSARTPGTAPSAPPAEDDLGAGAWLDDAPVVSPLGDPLQRIEILKRRREEFFQEVGGAGDLPAPSARVWIGFPDTSPTTADERAPITLGPNPHGFNVAWIARSLTCPEGPRGSCLSRVHMEQALPDPGATRRGTRSDLARAIYQTVTTWNARRGDSIDRRWKEPLIINLSVGWDPAHDCDPNGQGPAAALKYPSGLRAPPACPAGRRPRDTATHSVYGAVLHAVCSGALVVAAAGNDPGYVPPAEGPMLPAAWERHPRPSPAECRRLFPELPPLPEARSRYTPLVYAAAGVGPEDYRVPVSRVRALPRLVAPASLAVAYPDVPGQDGYPQGIPCPQSQLLTGTSISASVVSAVAATVWAYRPDLAAPDVMDIVHRAAVKLPRHSADFCLNRPNDEGCAAQPVGRVSLCNALREVAEDTCRSAAPASDLCKSPPVACAPRPAYEDRAAPPDPATFPCGDLRCERGQHCARDAGTGEHRCTTPPLVRPPPHAPATGQPLSPACPECRLTVDETQWKVNEMLDPLFFSANGVDSLQGTTLKIYTGETLLGSFAIDFGPPVTEPEVTVLGWVKGEVQVTGAPMSATLTWIQIIHGDRPPLTQEIPVIE